MADESEFRFIVWMGSLMAPTHRGMPGQPSQWRLAHASVGDSFQNDQVTPT
jgi:hypothetical protein